MAGFGAQQDARRLQRQLSEDEHTLRRSLEALEQLVDGAAAAGPSWREELEAMEQRTGDQLDSATADVAALLRGVLGRLRAQSVRCSACQSRRTALVQLVLKQLRGELQNASSRGSLLTRQFADDVRLQFERVLADLCAQRAIVASAATAPQVRLREQCKPLADRFVGSSALFTLSARAPASSPSDGAAAEPTTVNSGPRSCSDSWAPHYSNQQPASTSETDGCANGSIVELRRIGRVSRVHQEMLSDTNFKRDDYEVPMT